MRSSEDNPFGYRQEADLTRIHEKSQSVDHSCDVQFLYKPSKTFFFHLFRNHGVLNIFVFIFRGDAASECDNTTWQRIGTVPPSAGWGERSYI